MAYPCGNFITQFLVIFLILFKFNTDNSPSFMIYIAVES